MNIKDTYSFNRPFDHKSDKHSILNFCHLTKLTKLIGKQHAKFRNHRLALESSPKDHQTPTSLSSNKDFKTSIELLESYLIIIESSPHTLKTQFYTCVTTTMRIGGRLMQFFYPVQNFHFVTLSEK